MPVDVDLERELYFGSGWLEEGDPLIRRADPAEMNIR